VHSSNTKENSEKITLVSSVLPTLFAISTAMYAGWIIIYSLISTIALNILHLEGISIWMTQLTTRPLLVEHPAILFNLGITLPKTSLNIIFILVGWGCLVILISLLESGLYSYSLNISRRTQTTLIESMKKNWKKMLLFAILFTPIWILAGLLGFLTDLILLKTSLHPLIIDLIRFIFISAPLVILIPARFYFLNGDKFIESILKSFENVKHYLPETVLIIIPTGCVYLSIIWLITSKSDTLHLLISHAPFIFTLGVISWFFWSLSIFLTSRKFIKLKHNKTLQQGGQYD
jgi:hypothetical protein